MKEETQTGDINIEGKESKKGKITFFATEDPWPMRE
jgi:hypothetical protein